MDIIVRHALVAGKVLDIGIDKGIISTIQPSIEKKALDEFDAKGRVCIPGFVDAHLHLDKSLLNEEEVYQDVSGPEKGALTREMKKNFTVEDIMERAERVIRQAIRSGTLYLRTNVDVDDLVGTKGIEALLKLKEKYKSLIHIQVVAFAQEGFEKFPETYELLEESLEMGADLVGGHTIVDGSKGKEHIDKILTLAKKYEVEADFHLDESGNQEHYLLPYLCDRMEEEGMAGWVNAIHCCTLYALPTEERERAYQRMKEVGMKVTVAPTAISTRQLAPVKELIAWGIPIALGSDNVRDFFNPLGSGDVKQVALLLSYVHRFYKKEETQQIWNMITDDGAMILGIEDYGIQEGYPANLTILDETSPLEVLAKQAQPVLLIRNGVNQTDQYI